jgi:NADH:ubiquinone oxidoreductase subunit F (NADH-binding)
MALTETFAQELRSMSDLPCGTAGWPEARLLAGPPPRSGMESLVAHTRRLGGLRLPSTREDALAVAAASGLTGRGGGEFPFVEKLRAAKPGPCSPLVVVNGSEGEPASRKDRTLLELRPHTVLDGASWAAAAVGAPDAVLYLDPTRRQAVWDTVAAALWERVDAGLPDPVFCLAAAPDRFIAGETSAVVGVLEGIGPMPGRRPIPVAACGAGGRPTVVSNTETLAHLGLIARFGPDWFREAGSPCAPGSTLVTLAGDVAVPGLVVEVVEPVAVGRVLETFGKIREVPQAVLVGGYSGHWVSGAALWNAPLDRAVLKAAGCGLGCGLLAPLPRRGCGLAVTHRLLGFLADESSGQCGSCVFGLPTLVEGLRSLITGDCGRSGPDRLFRLSVELEGRGGCAHPDGAIALLQSALQVFSQDARRHARNGLCGREVDSGWFPVPRPARRMP